MKDYVQIALNDHELMSLVGKTIVDTFNTQRLLVVGYAYDGCENYITTIQGDGIHHYTASDLLSKHYWRLNVPEGEPLWHTPALMKWSNGRCRRIPLCKFGKKEFGCYDISVYGDDIPDIGYDGLQKAYTNEETLYIDEWFGVPHYVQITSLSYAPEAGIMSMELCPAE